MHYLNFPFPPHTVFTVNVESGALEPLHSEDTWLEDIHFSPHRKLDIFHADFEGASHIYALEIAAAR